MEDKIKEVLQFSILNVFACMDIQAIKQILPLPLLEPIPDAPIYLAGLMNLAGQSVPVVDLALRLKMRRDEPYSLYMPIILCSVGDRRAGFIIDKTYEVITLSPGALQINHELSPDSPFLGTVPYHDQLSLLINAPHLLRTLYTVKIKKESSDVT